MISAKAKDRKKPGKGHNSGPVQADRLKSFIERVERVEEDQAKLADGKRDIYSEAKAVGYDVKTMRKVVQLRKMDAADRAEQEALLETYIHALGMVDRIEARLTAGERPAAVAASEGVSRATAYRASQKVKRVENETPAHDADGVIAEPPLPVVDPAPRQPTDDEAMAALVAAEERASFLRRAPVSP